MRGIPRRAVAARLPVLGTDFTADQIADTDSVCPWNTDNYGLNHDHPGAQAYPGTELSLAHLDHLRENATMWRVSDDLWDRWADIEAQFARMARWAPFQRTGAWADADMLPLGRIGIRAERGDDRISNLTHDEQISLLTLWLISRSPLMMGGDLPTSPPETIDLLTNDEALAVLWHSTDNREVLREEDRALWTARDTDGRTRYAAVFSLAGESRRIAVPLGSIGAETRDRLRELWTHTDVPHDGRHLRVDLPGHGAILVRFTMCDDPDGGLP